MILPHDDQSPKSAAADGPPNRPDYPVAAMDTLRSPAPHDGEFAPVELRDPMGQDDEGNDVGEHSEIHSGASGHKGR